MSVRKKVIHGSRHQGDRIYGPNAGTQCVAMVESFFLYSQNVSVGNMLKRDIDNILRSGNNIYSSARKKSVNDYLLPTELPRIIGEGIWRCKIVPKLILHGKLHPDMEELLAGLTRAFSVSETLYFTAKDTCVGVRKVGNLYYVFDSHARNRNGFSHYLGKACIIHFGRFYHMAKYLQLQYGQVVNEMFQIVICEVESLPNKYEPSIQTYVDESSYDENAAVEEYVISSAESLCGLVGEVVVGEKGVNANQGKMGDAEEWQRVIYKNRSSPDIFLRCEKGGLIVSSEDSDDAELTVEMNSLERKGGNEQRECVGDTFVQSCTDPVFVYDADFPPLKGMLTKDRASETVDLCKTVRAEEEGNKCIASFGNGISSSGEVNVNGICSSESTERFFSGSEEVVACEKELFSSFEMGAEVDEGFVPIECREEVVPCEKVLLAEDKVGFSETDGNLEGDLVENIQGLLITRDNHLSSMDGVEDGEEFLVNRDTHLAPVDEDLCAGLSSEGIGRVRRQPLKSKTKSTVLNKTFVDNRMPVRASRRLQDKRENEKASLRKYEEEGEILISENERFAKESGKVGSKSVGKPKMKLTSKSNCGSRDVQKNKVSFLKGGRKGEDKNENSCKHRDENVVYVSRNRSCKSDPLDLKRTGKSNCGVEVMPQKVSRESKRKSAAKCRSKSKGLGTTDCDGIERNGKTNCGVEVVTKIVSRDSNLKSARKCWSKSKGLETTDGNGVEGGRYNLRSRKEVLQACEKERSTDTKKERNTGRKRKQKLLSVQEGSCNVEVDNGHVVINGVTEELCNRKERNVQYYEENARRITEKNYRKKVGQSVSGEMQFGDALIDQLNEGCNYICCACEQIYFKRSVKLISQQRLEVYRKYIDVFDINRDQSCYYICNTCYTAISKGNVVKLSRYNGMVFPELPLELKITAKEASLISPRLVFMNMHVLPRGCQLSLYGNVVCVPADIEASISSLPRHINAEGTVSVRLKRRLKYKSVYRHMNVRPEVVMAALKWLLNNSQLYAENEIDIDSKWLETTINLISQEAESCIENPSDDSLVNIPSIVIHEEGGEQNESASADNRKEGDVCERNSENKSENGDDECDNFSEVDPTEYNSMLPSLLDDEVDTTYLDIAPGEGNFPKNVYFDKYGEELAFPCIYGGHKMSDIYPLNIRLSERLRWELRNYDRRVAENAEKIFFMYKKYQNNFIYNKKSFAVRLLQNKKYRNCDVNDMEQLKKLLE